MPAGCEPAKVPSGRSAWQSAAATVEAVDPSAREDPSHDVDVHFEVPIGNPTRDQLVVVASAASPQPAPAGSTVTLAVRLRIAIGWHIRAIDGSDEPNATQLDLRLPEGIEAVGKWQFPEPAPYSGRFGESLIYEVDVTFRRQLTISLGQARGKLELPCIVTYQACNDRQCLRPMSTKLHATLEIAE